MFILKTEVFKHLKLFFKWIIFRHKNIKPIGKIIQFWSHFLGTGCTLVYQKNHFIHNEISK